MTTPTPPAGTSDDIGEKVPDELVLAGDFEAPSYERWAEEVAKVLNRGRPEDKLMSAEQALERLRIKTVDGLVIEPIYTKDDAIGDLGASGVEPFVRGATVRTGQIDAWDVRALYEDPDKEFTKKSIVTDLERGVTSIWLRVDADAIKPDDVEYVLSDVLLELAKIDVSSRGDQKAAAEALLKVCEASGKPKNHLTLNLGLDPIGFAALNGTTPELDGMAEWVKKVEGYKDPRAFVVDGTIYHNAGAGDVHETAWAIATGIEYVRALIEQGLSAEEAFDTINFRVTATADEVATIARLRALRLLWNRVGEVFEVSKEHRGARQHAVSSWREITLNDAYVNILRGTVATFSAAVGGAEAITVLPFDTAWGLPTDFSRRVARNTSVVLAEESNIGRVNDPAGGAWYIESLTHQIAEKAWEQLQTVEKAGGMAAYLEAGSVAAELETLNEARAKLLATRKLPITGVSEFPKLDEKPLSVRERPAALELGGLEWHRDSEVFEALRTATADNAAAKIFLACLGKRRDYGAREGFASNYFHIAGLETIEGEGLDATELIDAWKKADTPVVCLCSSPKVYGEHGFAIAKAFKEAGAGQVLLAGNIKELKDDAAADTIDGTIAMGKDVVAGLNSVLDTLGVNK